MFKKTFLSLILLLIIFANQISAHTYLKDSSPKEEEVITEDFQEITLIFDTRIEQNSSLSVYDHNDALVELNDITVEDDKMQGFFSFPLDSGEYKVIWKIVGIDGHPIDGEYTFYVDKPIENSTSDNNPKEEQEVNNGENRNEQNEEQEGTNEEQEETNEEQNNLHEVVVEDEQRLPTYLTTSLIVLLGVSLVGVLLWLYRRK